MPPDESFESGTLSAYNDEQAHLNHVKYFASHLKRPIQQTSVSEQYPRGKFEYEYYQSPLYYSLAGLLIRALPGESYDLYILRFVNALIGLALINIIGRIMLLFSIVYSRASMLFLSLLGSMVFFNATVTNDVLLWLFTALFTYHALLNLNSPGPISPLKFTIWLALAVWVKVSALVLLPAFILILAISGDQPKQMRRMIRVLLHVLILFMLLLPLFWDNFGKYGSIIPLAIGSGEPLNVMENLNPRYLYLTINYYLHTFYFPFANYWQGVFHFIIFLTLGIVSLLIIILGVRKLIVDFRSHSAWNRKAQLFLLSTLLLAIGGTLMMSFRFAQGEARMTFVALPAICYLLVYGSQEMLGRNRRLLLKFLLLLAASPYILLLI